ncbi:hypothetical protein JCM11251_006921 [Rhodosporidiobolus azoricus]
MSEASSTFDVPPASSSTRPTKRKRWSASPEVGKAGTSAAGAGDVVGPSSSKRKTIEISGKGKTKAEDEDDNCEPSTEDDDSGEEPSTEEEEDSMVVEQPKRTTKGGSAEGAVLDLTDEGDDTASSPAPIASSSNPRRISLLGRREGESLFSTADVITADSSDGDDDKDKKARPSHRDKGKSKGKARAASSPTSASAKPLSTSTDSLSDPSAPLGPDGEPLPTLNHLTCPICFGPPAPLALTSCGHAFCAPCLHASLVAGPALTPPPQTGPAAAGRGGYAGRGAYASRGGYGSYPPGTFDSGYGGSSASGRGGARGAAAAGGNDEDGDPDLNKHCPVCRTALKGGWGKSLRGLVLRMGPARKA